MNTDREKFIRLITLGQSPPLWEVETGTQGENLKAGLLAISQSIISHQGTHFSAKCGRNHGGCCLLANRQDAA